MIKRINSFFGFLKPQRIDTPMVLLGLLIISAALVPEFISFKLAYSLTRELCAWSFAALLIIGSSIGAGLGAFDRKALWRERWFVASVVGVMIYGGFILQRENLLFRAGSVQGARDADVGRLPLVLEGWIVCLMGMLGAFGATKLLFLCVESIKRQFQIGTVSRQQMLVGVAIVLFVCLTARNVLIHQDFQWIQTDGKEIPPTFLLFIGMASLLIGAAIPAWLVSNLRGGWGWLVSVVFLGAVTGFTSLFVPVTAQLLIAAYALTYSCIVVALTSYRDRCNTTELPRHAGRFWGPAAILIAVSTAIVFWNLNLSGLILGGKNRIEIARKLKKISTSSGVEAAYSIWPTNTGVSSIRADLVVGSGANSACLSTLSGLPNTIYLYLTGLNPAIETTTLRTASLVSGSVADSRVSIQQIEDIFQNSAYVVISNCQLVEPNELDSEKLSSIVLASSSSVHLLGMSPDETGRFLEKIDVNQFASEIQIGHRSDLSKNDWKQILDRSQYFPISVRQRPPQAILDEMTANDPETQLSFFLMKTPDRDYWDLVINTKFSVRIIPPNSNESAENFWDAVFVSRGINWADQILNRMDKPRPDSNLRELSQRFHWEFDVDGSGNPRGMFLPFGVALLDQLVAMDQLTTLSMDPRWLTALQNFDDPEIPRPKDVSALGNLTQLKRLDLASGLWVSDFAFLQQMPELEHLQFDVFVDGRTQVDFGFLAANCPNLRSLVLFGKPSKPLAMEIAKLPKLESVKLIDIDSTIIGKGLRDQIQKAIGSDIGLTIVPFDQDRPALPASFSMHVQRVRASIRKKYLSGEPGRAGE